MRTHLGYRFASVFRMYFSPPRHRADVAIIAIANTLHGLEAEKHRINVTAISDATCN
ncbi:MAG: hypothetical protein M3Y27_05220 [Acidobacteriota bacterium]|nr:hypothetical protein [Acidobacteriota bacterium]